MTDDGNEIQVDTASAHQQKGLATLCASALILAYREEGKCLSWDAANERSLRLAKRIGYRRQRVFAAYKIDIWEV